MNWLVYALVNLIETLLRVLPIPRKTGLVKIGNPGRHSPVFLTCNYHLTVERVKRALRGMDAYLLVANSRGVNVWCAATGGLLTNHDVISAIKTSGIEERVDHREVILPQLAATGVEGKVIRQRTGWKVIWGPVYARDIPRFMERGREKTPQMREVAFPLVQRIEMAVAWAFPISLVLALVLLLFWREAILPLAALVWALSVLIFLSFPLYERLLATSGTRVGFVFFDFGRGGMQLLLWGAFLAGLVIYGKATGTFSWGFFARWGLLSLVVVLMVSMDLTGSTPVYKSGLHKDRLFRVVLDEQKCKGAAFCEQVCPRNCYEVDHARHLATMPRGERCVQCGACIVQCPFDALCFVSPKGEVLLPNDVRTYKLNLMGERLVKAG